MYNSIDIVKLEKQKRALMFIDNLDSQVNLDDKVKLLIDMMTQYDKINAKNFAEFCMDIYQDRAIHSRDCKLIDKIKELDLIIKEN